MMTLNITLLTPGAIYQSADFRLRDLSDGSFMTDRSAKTVVLQYPTWSGFVTYTGLGSWQNRSISEFIADWLDDKINGSMWEVAALCKARERVFSAAPDRKRNFSTLFTLAGFEDNVIRAFVVSNFEDCYGEEHSPTDDYLTITSREFRTWSGASVIVTGRKKAVPVMERRILRQLAAKNPEDGGLIRRRMQDLNALAAASPKSGGGVSQGCGVISFRFDGYGVLQLGDASGIGPGQIPMISNGVNTARFMAEAMSKLGIDMSRMRMTNATLVSTNNPGPASSLRAPCTFPIAETDSSGGYEIHEITGDDFEPLVAEDVNDVDHVVGTGRGEQAVPWTTQIPWLGWDGHASKLDYDGSAWAISVNNQIAALVTEGTGEKAARYAEGRIEVLSLYDGDGTYL